MLLFLSKAGLRVLPTTFFQLQKKKKKKICSSQKKNLLTITFYFYVYGLVNLLLTRKKTLNLIKKKILLTLQKVIIKLNVKSGV